jgi:hypothetical protein
MSVLIFRCDRRLGVGLAGQSLGVSRGGDARLHRENPPPLWPCPARPLLLRVPRRAMTMPASRRSDARWHRVAIY